jgi:hypothetical protein
MNTLWNKDYYEMIEFYFWEPQHLGKITNPANPIKTLDDSMKKIGKMEVALNHMFNTFFRFCPSTVLSTLLGSITGNDKLGSVKYQSRYNTEKKIGRDATQADVLLIDESNIVGIELKLESKSSLEQIYKYAMLFNFEKDISGKDKNLYLIYITKNDFPSIFKEKFRSEDLVKSKFSINQIPDKTKKGNISLLDKKKDIVATLNKTNIYFLTFTDYYEILNKIKTDIDVSDKYSDMLLMLINGLLNELETRQLS